ncbi:hypothetical protein ACF3DV_10070 [Chlorogloeopsis fritschii PCC 9212]|uniref:hypothetical protein n=1 Tax=Chlorogloeopsis fritschii TaxID=1124 RepID=UPI00030671B3|nr:hypothetical protein [Chlorogloeopsis fritschii]
MKSSQLGRKQFLIQSSSFNSSRHFFPYFKETYTCLVLATSVKVAIASSANVTKLTG